jgi:hypothetical protein
MLFHEEKKQRCIGRSLIFFRRPVLQTFWSILPMKKKGHGMTLASRIKVKGDRVSTETSLEDCEDCDSILPPPEA